MKHILLSLILAFSVLGCAPAVEDPTITAFVTCLAEQNVVMYGSVTCSYCTQQKKLFGPSSVHLSEVECNPHQENSESERCLEQKVRVTPTWIKTDNGQEINRLEGFQQLETLAEFSGCSLDNTIN